MVYKMESHSEDSGPCPNSCLQDGKKKNDPHSLERKVAMMRQRSVCVFLFLSLFYFHRRFVLSLEQTVPEHWLLILLSNYHHIEQSPLLLLKTNLC